MVRTSLVLLAVMFLLELVVLFPAKFPLPLPGLQSLRSPMARSKANRIRSALNVGTRIVLGFDAKPQLRRSTHGSTLRGADKLSAATAKTRPTHQVLPPCVRCSAVLQCKFAVCIAMPASVGGRGPLASQKSRAAVLGRSQLLGCRSRCGSLLDPR